jgi:hypothetical protein
LKPMRQHRSEHREASATTIPPSPPLISEKLKATS